MLEQLHFFARKSDYNHCSINDGQIQTEISLKTAIFLRKIKEKEVVNSNQKWYNFKGVREKINELKNYEKV